MIVLFGAEVSFATQNVRAFELEADCATLSHAARRRVALAIARHCVEAFSRGRTPPSADEISSELELPIRLVRSTLSELTAAGLLSEVGRDDRGAVAYQPGRPVDDLTIAGVLGSLDDRGTDAIPMAESGHGERIREVLRGLRETSAKSPDNVRIREL
jgi:membrane protein